MNHDKKKTIRNFGRYAGLGFQMLATIAVFVFAGYYIDKARNSERPIFTALLGLFGVIVSLYQVIRSFSKKDT